MQGAASQTKFAGGHRRGWRLDGAGTRRCLAPLVLAGALALVGAPALAIGAAPAGATPAPISSHITLQLETSAVKPGQQSVFLATVTPRRAGRAVTLKEVVNGRLLGVVRVLTNRLGEATLRTHFSHAGSVVVRATVAASPSFSGRTSAPVTELVTQVLPLELPPNVTLAEGSSGPLVLQLQKHLSALGYWLGTPDANFGDGTQQAVYALQKAAGLARTGVVNAATVTALNKGVLPQPRTTSGNAIDVNLELDLVMIVHNGKIFAVLNTSTGGGYTYYESGASNVAITPRGVFHVYRQTDGIVVDSLGSLWRPKFFTEGYAIHGDGYVPPFPVSHGCVRVSNEAIDWIWANNLINIGTEVWVY